MAHDYGTYQQRRERRREEARARQEAAAARPAAEQLDRLDDRGVDAVKERAKLILRMNAENTQPAKKKAKVAK